MGDFEKFAEVLMKSAIYIIKNKNTNKYYIGSAVNYENRLKQHISLLSKGNHNNKLLQNSYNKHGYEAFEFGIIELVDDKSKLIEREQFWLDKTQCYDIKIGYNLYKNARSPLGIKYSDDVKARMSEAHKGIKQSKLSRLKRSETMKKKGVKLSSIKALLKGGRRNNEKWSCIDGIKCQCEVCLAKKREYQKLWARASKEKIKCMDVFMKSHVDFDENCAIITVPMDKWDIIKNLWKL